MKETYSESQNRRVISTYFRLVEISFIIICALCIMAYFNYKLFHTFIEFSTVTLKCCIIASLIRVFDKAENSHITFLAIAIGMLGTFDLVHFFVSKQFDIFKVHSFNLSIQIKLLEKLLESISLLISFKYINSKINPRKVFHIYIGILIIAIIFLFYIPIFPKCYVEGKGITEFKILVSYFILALQIAVIFFAYKYLRKNNTQEYRLIVTFMIFIIISQVFFNFYEQENIFLNILGYLFKLLAYICFYELVVTSLVKGYYENISHNLENDKYQIEVLKSKIYNKNLELESNREYILEIKRIYKGLIDYIDDAIIVSNMSGKKICYVNTGAVKLLKAKYREDLIGLNMTDLIHDDYKILYNQMIKEETDNKPLQRLEEKIIDLDNCYIDVEASYTSFHIGEKKYYVTIMRDISGRKIIHDMEVKIEETIQMDRVRTEFFANLSHELRTPINVIYSALQLEDIYIGNGSIENIEKYNKVIKQNCLRLLRMINNIIDITKIDAGFFKPVFRKCNIVEIVESIVLSVVSYIESKNMDIVFDTQIEEVYINCDPDLIERIVLNLLSNSVKYGKKNGHIFVNIYMVDNDNVAVSIKDDGIGIPKEKQENIFKRFVQVDKTYTEKCEGSGIGLSLVDSLVKMNYGKISLESEMDEGTVFIIEFPSYNVDDDIDINFENFIESDNVVEKANIEFSDIYM